jgi:ankyrin repeat protein
MEVEHENFNFNCNASLVAACKVGDYNTAINMIEEHKATSFDGGLRMACTYGHINVVKLMIQRGAKNLNWGLNAACRYGHFEIVKLLIQHDANDWDWGFEGACEGNHTEIGKLMISKGANDLPTALSHNRFQLAASIMDKNKRKYKLPTVIPHKTRCGFTEHVLDEILLSSECKSMYDRNILSIVCSYISKEQF